jgi:hypothetical protein
MPLHSPELSLGSEQTRRTSAATHVTVTRPCHTGPYPRRRVGPTTPTRAGRLADASVDPTDARNDIVGCFGRSDRRAQHSGKQHGDQTALYGLERRPEFCPRAGVCLGDVRRGRCEHADEPRGLPVQSPFRQVRHVAELPGRVKDLLAHRRAGREGFLLVSESKRRAGIEGTISQGVHTCGLRRSRSIGAAKAHLQHVATAAAINVTRISDWLA